MTIFQMKTIKAITLLFLYPLLCFAQPTPGGSLGTAVDPNGNLAFLQVDSLGNVLLSGSGRGLAAIVPGGQTGVALDPSNNFAFLHVDSNGGLLTSGGGGGGGTVTSVTGGTSGGVTVTFQNTTTTPSISAISLAAIAPTTVNGLTISTTTGTLTVANGKTLTASNSITLAGTDSTTMTFPASSATVAGLGIAETWTAAQTYTNSDLLLLGSSTGYTTFTSANSSATNYTVTVPAATGTLMFTAGGSTLNPEFNSIGVAAAASGTAGEINLATGANLALLLTNGTSGQSTYNVVSLNNNAGFSTGIGMLGGHTGDANLYILVPSSGIIYMTTGGNTNWGFTSLNLSVNNSASIGSTSNGLGTLYMYSGGTIQFGSDTSATIVRSAAGTITSTAIWKEAGLAETGATFAGTVTLSSGAGTITSAAIASTSVVVLSLVTSSGTPGTFPPLTTVSTGSCAVAGLSTDNSTYNWRLIQ